MAALVEPEAQAPRVVPAGVIFHVSRCGSTLIANALKARTNTVVLSEAQPIGRLLNRQSFRRSPYPPQEHMSQRSALLGAILGAFAKTFTQEEPRLIIKAHAAGILQIAAAREVWPNVPFLILVRDPVEVMVSNHLSPGSWWRSRHLPLDGRSLFGWSAADAERMTEAEYGARGLGRFYEMASRQLDAGCTVMDYTDLDVTHVLQVMKLFGASPADSEVAAVLHEIQTYSKGRDKRQPFKPDSARKQNEASAETRLAADRWAMDSYSRLLTKRTLADPHHRPGLAPTSYPHALT